MPTDFDTKIIEEFRANRGAAPSVGDMPLVLLHHVGRRSGGAHVTPLAYIEDGGRYVLLASGGGRPHNPGWYENIHAAGGATIEIGTATIAVTVADAEDDERDRLFQVLIAAVPSFAEFIEGTTRAIPVVLLSPVA